MVNVVASGLDIPSSILVKLFDNTFFLQFIYFAAASKSKSAISESWHLSAASKSHSLSLSLSLFLDNLI